MGVGMGIERGCGVRAVKEVWKEVGCQQHLLGQGTPAYCSDSSWGPWVGPGFVTCSFTLLISPLISSCGLIWLIRVRLRCPVKSLPPPPF